MSGGSYNYAYRNIEEIEIRPKTALRRAFQAHLALVAKAMHDIEWVDSSDYSDGAEDEAIRACLGSHGELDHLIKEAKEAHAALGAMIREKQQ